MRRTIVAGLALLLALVAAPVVAHAQTVTIRLGTVAPEGSTWHLLLKEMGEKWAADTGGKVKLKIFPGGIQGNEGDVIKKMRIGGLQAGAVSIVGLRDIDWGPEALGTPGLLNTDDEFQYALEKLGPVWEKRLAEKGFIVLSWGDTGWCRLFSKVELRTPGQAKDLKMFAWASDTGSEEAWKLVGFRPVVISATDMLPSLTTGMIDAFATTPILAMTARWYEPTKYMPDVNWGRLAGATIVSKDAWEKIPEEVRPKLLASARSVGEKINAEVAKMGRDAIDVMKKNGLEVLDLTPAERAEWQAAAEKTWPVIRTKVSTPEDFDLVKATRDEFRAKQGKK